MNDASFSVQHSPLPLLESDQLRTFIAIAETGSFTRAAGQIFRTTSAVSMQIKRLEQTLGHSLFVREARQVRLTPEGETLLGYARRLLKLNEEAVAHFVRAPIKGLVRFGTPSDVGSQILPGILALFARSHPGIQVEVSAGRSIELLERLDDGELDLTLISIGNAGQDEARGELIHSEPLVWAGRDGGLAVERSPLPLALSSQDCRWRRTALDALDRMGKPYRIAYSSEYCAGQAAAMLADLAIAPFPLSLVQPPLRQLGAQHGLPELGQCHIKLVRSSNRGSAVEALALQIAAAFRAPRR
ncbi:LysR family transcriptional regulator [Stutzerimonas azotifigens]|uniref:LysR family transcriptional regulator n=1 Tax=Stutzerimonas azotifigens TaxID=291995 RepID=A0ABR5YW84_9GAMM|nr:LysR family transcriptional regulator [Stutzerimonas azotifigens]MBA1272176.1 LysR family transcriptional regulator [Stutzerimonas azotifigens]